ncbi:hypothetical protein PHYC_03582 [Phycisphaerales bacterium]|nr:hypothetical protein PHYC_03582 [Phycisphaerales bacterium]
MMSRTRMLALGGLGVVVAGAILLALSPRGGETRWLTDGAEIRVRAAVESPRRVLWTPPKALRPGPGADEYEPKVSADGTTMVLVRRKPGENADLFTSRWTPQGWTAPAPISELDSEHDELGPEFSFDGSLLYFYSDRPGGMGGYDIWVSAIGERGWETPVNLGPAVNSTWNDYGPAIAPDGSKLYFSSNRPRADEPAPRGEAWGATIRERRNRHDYDLYVSRLVGREPASAAQVLVLNTSADEGAPAVSPAGDFLYFASDRTGGLGGFDLYRARLRRDRTDLAESLGQAVNSPFNDLDPGLSADGFRLFFSSDRGIEPGSAVAGLPAESPTASAYALWFSSSREVYDEVERASGEGWWWAVPWKWLGLLLAALVPLAILLWLLRKAEWRRRFVHMSLLAQCLIVSLILHALVASLLAVWRVGSGIADYIREGGGGTRVILGSAEAVGGADGGIESQILGSAIELDALAAQPPAALLPDSPRIESPTFAAPVSPLDSPPSPAPVTLAEAPLTSPDPSPRVIAAAPLGDSPPSIVPDTPQPPGPALEPASDAPTASRISAAVDALPVTSASVAIPLEQPRMQANAAPPLRLPGETGAAVADTPAQSVSPAPPTSPAGTASTALPTIIPGSGAGNDSPERGGPGLPAISGAAAPATEGAAVTSAPVHIAPSTSAGVGRAGGSLALRPGDSPANPSTPTPRVGAGVVGAIPGGSHEFAALPKALPASGAAAQSAQTPAVSEGETNVRPLAPAAVLGSPLGSESVRIPLAKRASSLPAGASLGLAFAAGPSMSADVPAKDTSAASPAVAGMDASASARLPEIPAEPVSPVETFSQRAPEVRGEILQRTGGSNETEQAVGRALEWFSRNQESDGRWSSREHGAEIDADAAMTGMALLCYLGAGHTHLRDGPYRDNVAKGLNWLRARQDPSGDLRRGETMYGQTVATVALCEALAMTRDQSLAEPARRAVNLVLSRATGQRSRDERDTSVIGWLVFTVESARRAGIDVPANVFDAAGNWLDTVSAPGSPGRYSYSRGEAPSAAMTAEAMFVRQLLGHTRDEPQMRDSARFILQTPPRWQDGAPTHYWYYATLALFQYQGEEWKQWNDALVRELLAHQSRDGELAGSWAPKDQWSRMGGRVYQTAVCTLSLEVYYRYRAE